MFGSKKRLFGARGKPAHVETLIGKGTVIEGKIVSEAGLRVEGHVRGDIESTGDVSIGEQGVVHSNIVARNLYAAGTIHGSVKTEGRLVLAESGKLFGTIDAGLLNIAEGALFQGSSKMEPRPAGGKDAIPIKAKGENAKESGKDKPESQAAG